MGTIILTSTGLSNDRIADYFLSVVGERRNNSAVAIITTAAEGKEKNKYAQLAKSQFVEAGFVKIDFIDIETEP